jgi:hypothetical protein
MVTEIRKDSKHGSDDLLVFSWICLSIGGVYTNLGASLIGQLFGFNYNFTFLVPITLAMLVAAIFIDSELDCPAK